MTSDQTLIISIIAVAVIAFLSGRLRHDVVALAALVVSVLAGVVPSAEAFGGFGHPAVITVACVLVLSRSVQDSGAIDIVTQRLMPASAGMLTTTVVLVFFGMVLSAFMNNVGALALLMPVAIQAASRHGVPPGKILMPLSFGTILGGMTTLIGTPPNLIVSDFRARTVSSAFEMFDFTAVGFAVAVTGVLFLVLIGWRFVPKRSVAGVESFETGAYLTEAHVPEKSKAVGMLLHEIESALEQAEARVVGLVRGDARIPAPSPYREIRTDDILVIQAEPEMLAAALVSLGLNLEEEVRDASDTNTDIKDSRHERTSVLRSDDVVLVEFVVLPNSELIGHSATHVRLRTRFGINLLAVSRQGRRSVARLRSMPLKNGDVLLMQGAPASLAEFATRFACVPLAERALHIPNPRRALAAAGVLMAAVGIAAIGLLPTAVAFAAGVLAAVALGVTSPRTTYRSIDWTVIVLLGALIPVAEALANTGAADVIARFFIDEIARGHVVIGLIGVLVISMTLSDFMNNAATAAVMCPIAIGTAEHLSQNPDTFLMAVAIGASCAFLTPIGHQNNTLILGPGGFRFGDFWRIGLPLEIIVVVVGTPMLLLVWPLSA